MRSPNKPPLWDLAKAIAEAIVNEPKDLDEWWARSHGDEEYYFNKKIKYAGEIHALLLKLWNY